MPWNAKDASRHTKKAKTASQKRQWSHVANTVLKSTKDEGRAVRSANAVLAQGYAKRGSAK